MTFYIIFINENMTSSQVVEKVDFLEKSLGKYFPLVFKSITMDNGKEFADTYGLSRTALKTRCPTIGQEHISIDTSVQPLDTSNIRVKLYYCHPSTPQERGTNENINKMVRKYIPKGTNFDNETIESIKYIQEEINNYPRGIFNYDTSNERFRKELQDLHIPKSTYAFLFH